MKALERGAIAGQPTRRLLYRKLQPINARSSAADEARRVGELELTLTPAASARGGGGVAGTGAGSPRAIATASRARCRAAMLRKMTSWRLGTSWSLRRASS